MAAVVAKVVRMLARDVAEVVLTSAGTEFGTSGSIHRSACSVKVVGEAAGNKGDGSRMTSLWRESSLGRKACVRQGDTPA